MAKVESTFESVVGAYFDGEIAPGLVSSGTPEDAILFLRGRYVQDVARNDQAVKEIENFYGVTII